jgi:hypothetical protein
MLSWGSEKVDLTTGYLFVVLLMAIIKLAALII